MKKALCVIVVIGFLLIGALSVAAETYTVLFLPLVGYSEYKVAEVKGFWEKQGVTVKLIDYSVVAEAKRSGVQRRIDFVPLPMPTVARYWDEGTGSTYLGTFSIANQHKAVVIKNVLTNKNLKGQTVGTFLIDTSNAFLLSTYLNTVNTRLSDVRLVEMGSDDLEANFAHNRLKVVLDVNRGYIAYKQADGVIALSTEDVYEPHGLSLVREGGLEAIPPEDLKKILRGCIEAIMWIRDPGNWEEYKGILQQHVFPSFPDLPDEQFRVLVKDTTFVEPKFLVNHNQQTLSDYFTKFRAFLTADEVLKADVLKKFTYENVIKNQALIEVLQEYVQ